MIKLTHVLYRIFIRSYYRAHASQLLIFFTLFGMYFFFTPVLKDSLLSFSERIYHNLLLAIAIVSEPLFALLYLAFYLVFMVRANRYIRELLLVPQNGFLFYSANSLAKSKQLFCCALTSAGIALPFLVFLAFSLVIALINGYYIIPLLLIAFTVTGIIINSAVLVKFLNAPVPAVSVSFPGSYLSGKRKPLFSMFLLYAAEKLPGTCLLSKALALLLIFFLYYLFGADMNSYQFNAVSALLVTLSNSYLLFEENRFNTIFLRFYRNLPVSANRVFMQTGLTWVLILLPEGIALGSRSAWWALPCSVVLLLFFRAVLMSGIQDFKRYFYFVLLLFVVLFLAVQFNVFGVFLVICIIISYRFFLKFYFDAA